MNAKAINLKVAIFTAAAVALILALGIPAHAAGPYKNQQRPGWSAGRQPDQAASGGATLAGQHRPGRGGPGWHRGPDRSRYRPDRRSYRRPPRRHYWSRPYPPCRHRCYRGDCGYCRDRYYGPWPVVGIGIGGPHFGFWLGFDGR